MASQTRRDSVASHQSASQTSQTAREFIESQLQLEADAREALPYSFDSCTYPLGPLRQSLFACLTCNPPEKAESAGVCYSCSIACHGEHTLVELFSKRNFVCDCGTTRLTSSPCMLRTNQQTNAKGARDDQPGAQNSYNQNFQNRFCGCGEAYDSETEKGTMFQCLGLGAVEDGGCGEDWWHPECLVGLPRDWHKADKEDKKEGQTEERDGKEDRDEEEPPLPPGFPGEDDFEAFLCYKCIDSNPWLKAYAGTTGFLPAVHYQPQSDSKKRKLDDQEEVQEGASKRPKNVSDPESQAGSDTKTDAPKDSENTQPNPDATKTPPKHTSLPSPTPNRISLFLREDFRDHLCHCPTCFPNLARHPQLREEEDTYEPPLSDDGNEPNGGGSTGTGSLLDRGEAALSNIDRVRAIEGAMVYNHLRDKVKEFLTPFAESGQAVGAEDIKAYFENLRGDEQGIRDAAGQASSSREDHDRDRDRDHAGDREQSGY